MKVVVGYGKWVKNLEEGLERNARNSSLTPNLNSHGTPKTHDKNPTGRKSGATTKKDSCLTTSVRSLNTIRDWAPLQGSQPMVEGILAFELLIKTTSVSLDSQAMIMFSGRKGDL